MGAEPVLQVELGQRSREHSTHESGDSSVLTWPPQRRAPPRTMPARGETHRPGESGIDNATLPENRDDSRWSGERCNKAYPHVDKACLYRHPV